MHARSSSAAHIAVALGARLRPGRGIAGIDRALAQPTPSPCVVAALLTRRQGLGATASGPARTRRPPPRRRRRRDAARAPRRRPRRRAAPDRRRGARQPESRRSGGRILRRRARARKDRRSRPAYLPPQPGPATRLGHHARATSSRTSASSSCRWSIPAGSCSERAQTRAAIDLMRNAPVEAEEPVPWLIGGQRISASLPWYRGPAGAAMQAESSALAEVVERELLARPFSIALDCHSGFGAVDRIWFPFAHTHRPIDHLGELNALSAIFEATPCAPPLRDRAAEPAIPRAR